MPQKLSFNHFPDLPPVLAQYLVLHVVFLQHTEVLAQSFESVHVVADVLKLLQHHSLLQSVERNLHHLLFILSFLHCQVLLNQGFLSLSLLSMQSQLHDHATLNTSLIASLKSTHDFGLQHLLPHVVNELLLVSLQSLLVDMLPHLLVEGGLDQCRDEGVHCSAVLLLLKKGSHLHELLIPVVQMSPSSDALLLTAAHNSHLHLSDHLLLVPTSLKAYQSSSVGV